VCQGRESVVDEMQRNFGGPDLGTRRGGCPHPPCRASRGIWQARLARPNGNVRAHPCVVRMSELWDETLNRIASQIRRDWKQVVIVLSQKPGRPKNPRKINPDFFPATPGHQSNPRFRRIEAILRAVLAGG